MKAVDRLSGLGGAHVEARQHPGQRGVLALDVPQRAEAGQRLDAPDAGGDAALLQDDERPDVAGGAAVRAAAQLHAEARDRDDAHRSPYFSPNSAIAPAAIASSVERTSVWTGVLRHDLLVDDPLDLRDLVARERREVHEVEPQAIRRHERAGLLDVRAEHLAQRRVQQVRRGVIAARRVAHLVGDLRGHQVARLHAPCSTCTRCSRGQPVALATPCTMAANPPDSAKMRPLSDTWPPDSR